MELAVNYTPIALNICFLLPLLMVMSLKCDGDGGFVVDVLFTATECRTSSQFYRLLRLREENK